MKGLIEKLKKSLQADLPSYSAHQKVMKHRLPVDRMGELPRGARESAVLVLLYPKENTYYTVFILRTTYSGVHSGQIGLPGGEKRTRR